MKGSDNTPGRVCISEDGPGRKRPREEPWGPRGSDPGAKRQPVATACVKGYRCPAAFVPRLRPQSSALGAPGLMPHGLPVQ